MIRLVQARTIERRPVTDRRPQRTRIPLLWRLVGTGAVLHELGEIREDLREVKELLATITTPVDTATLTGAVTSLQETGEKLDKISPTTE